MDNNPSPSALPSLANAIYILATSLATLAGAVIGFLFRRRQQSAEIHKTNAETSKTEAQTRQIDSSILFKAYERLDELEIAARRQSNEIIELEQKVSTLEFEGRIKDAKLITRESEISLLNMQVQRARAAGFLAEDRQPHSPNPAA